MSPSWFPCTARAGRGCWCEPCRGGGSASGSSPAHAAQQVQLLQLPRRPWQPSFIKSSAKENRGERPGEGCRPGAVVVRIKPCSLTRLLPSLTSRSTQGGRRRTGRARGSGCARLRAVRTPFRGLASCALPYDRDHEMVIPRRAWCCPWSRQAVLAKVEGRFLFHMNLRI